MLRLLVKNAGSNVSVMIVKMCFSFIMAPVIVHALGNYDYGLWEVVVSLAGYMGLLDVGMRPAVTRYVARYNAVNDRKSLEELFSTAVTFSGIVGLLAFTVLMIWVIYKPDIIGTNHSFHYKYAFFILIIGVQLLFQFPGYIAECFHMGYQRHYLKNNITILNMLVVNAVLYYFLTHGHGLLVLAVASCLGFAIKYVIYFILLYMQKYGAYRYRANCVSIQMLRRLLLFGGKSFLAGAAGTISAGMSKIMIGIFCGPASVPFYSIPARLVTYLSEFVMTAANVFMPMFSHLHSADDEHSIKELYLTATKYIVALSSPMAIGISLLGPYFIHRWIGPEYAKGCTYILYFLSTGIMLYMVNPLFSRFLTGTGKVGFLAVLRSIGSVLLFVFTLLFIRPYGNKGVAFAFMITYAIMAPIEFQYATKELGLKPVSFISRVYVPLILPNVILLFFVRWILNWLHPYTYPEISAVALSAVPVYLVTFILFSMTGREKEYVYYRIKKIFT